MSPAFPEKSEILRILDANFNRSREGLRVCEEITRFVLEDKNLTADLKKARHAVSDCLKVFPVSCVELVAARNVRGDVGKKPSPLENQRGNFLGLFLANAERAKESLRVLEETSKFIDTKISGKFKKARFRVYAIEKKALPRLEALRDHGPRAPKRKAA